MHELSAKEKELVIKLNVEELNPTQVRLIKTINSMMAHLLTADEEAEFFDASSTLLRKMGELIKHSGFALSNTDMNYGDQALEFAVDFLNESRDPNGTIDN